MTTKRKTTTLELAVEHQPLFPLFRSPPTKDTHPKTLTFCKIFRQYREEEPSMDLHQSRNLSVRQTLDEILGTGPPPPPSSTTNSSSSIFEKNAVNSPIRPPTRHGRESAGSNEENVEQSTSSSSTNNFEKRQSLHGKDDQVDDEFLKKINDIRRRSLVKVEPTPPQPILREITESSTRLPIHLEVEEAAPSVSTPQRQPSNLTFRVEETDKEPKKPVKKEETAELISKSMFAQEPESSTSHHEKWLKKKLKEEKLRKEQKLREEEAKKEAEKERRDNAKKLFERWKSDRDEKIRLEVQEKREKAKKEKERKKEEKQQKSAEASKNFEVWTRERSKSVSDLRRKMEEDRINKEKEAEIVKAEKQRESKAAFEGWLKKKKSLENHQKEQKTKNSKQLVEQKETEEYQKLLAREAYLTWLEMKDHERDIIADMVLIEAPPIPWIPPSNLVPRRFVASANGRRKTGASRSQSAKGVRTRSRPVTTSLTKPANPVGHRSLPRR